MAYAVTTLAEFRLSLQRRWEEAAFWTDEEARLAINEALRDWNLLTGRWRRRTILDVLANIPTVDLGGSLIYGMRVRFGVKPLVGTSLAELDLARPTWRFETVATGGDVPVVPTLWAPVSLQQIVIWPASATDVSGVVLVDGIAATPVLVEDADYVDIGEETIDILSDFALHIAAFKRGGPEWRNTKPFWQAFLKAAAEENSLLKTKQAFRRYAGLNRTRDLLPAKGRPTQMDEVGQAATKGQAG